MTLDFHVLQVTSLHVHLYIPHGSQGSKKNETTTIIKRVQIGGKCPLVF
jgi:hypothetical protein